MIVARGLDPSAASVLAAGLGGPVDVLPDVPAALQVLAGSREDSLVLLGPELAWSDVLRDADLIRQARPDVLVVVLRSRPNRLERHEALEAGVSAILPATDLRTAGIACRDFLAARSSGGAGRIVTVLAGTAGAGTTTVATNLAVALASSPARRVALVDLDLRSGDVAVTLGLTPERTLVPGPVGGDVLAAMVTPYRPGLDCLLAPVSPGMAERLEADGVGSLFASLARAYDVVVVDAPAAFTGPVVAALDRSDHHVLVTTPIRPALQRLRRTLDVMDALGHRRDSRSVLINRTHGATGITTEEIERLLRAPVAGSIPWSPDVAPSINAGTPLAQSCPDHPVSLAVRRSAQSLLPAPALVPSPRAGAP